MKSWNARAVVVFLSGALGAVALPAESPPAKSTGEQAPAPIVALGGLDPVALVDGARSSGRSDLAIVRGRFEYRFASPESRYRFEAAPERYEVQRDGECMAMPGVKTDASIFEVHEGRIYAFGTLLCRERFRLSPRAFIDRGARREIRPRKVAIVLFEGVELLDFAGPGEVFDTAQTIDGQTAFEVFTVAATAEPVTSQGFVRVTPEYTIETSPPPDILVLPGGGVEDATRDERLLAWIRSAAGANEITMSVCNGAYFLARVGLLDGQRATTHWAAIPGLRSEAATATVVENVRFVDNGRVITTAGVSAGIDGALHVVDRLLGRPAARLTARAMEYDWRPTDPSAGVVVFE
jgi:putative intracellular protease/amidase